jgi:3-phenylpropionate/trans-cinnamate dioxygenase ferredoxin reductase subunit
MTPQRIAIVGAGLAGASAAVNLRERGFDGEIQLIGAEAHLPYNRPPLSKGYLRGEERFDDQLVKPGDYYAQQRIEVLLGKTATAVDPVGKTVTVTPGGSVGYDRLLIATGGRNRTPSFPGAHLEGVLQLRTVDDCDRIREAARGARRAVLIGLGFIGCEVAASLRQIGLEVTAIDGQRAPLARVLGDEVGSVLASIHRDKGVHLLLEDSVARFEGNGRVERVRCGKGSVIDCDFAVAGIGITPNTELFAKAGAAIDNGVLVDARCRTSLPDIYAAGDVANHLHPLFGRLRVEHWNNGLHHGHAAAAAMLGSEEPYDYLHSFWSDQYEHVIEYVGFASSWDRLVFRGRAQDRKFLGFYLKDGVMRAAVGVDRGGDPEDSRDSELKSAARLIRRRARIDPARLADEGTDLRQLDATTG